MTEGGGIEDYLNKARELKNRLTILEEPISDKILVKTAFNTLPRSYEYIIPNIINALIFPTFERTSAILLTEYHQL